MRKVMWLIVGAVSAIQVSNAATIAFINTTGNLNFNYSLSVR
jgi:hypothetical protein